METEPNVRPPFLVSENTGQRYLVSVVVPLFNEEGNVGELIDQIEAAFARLPNYDHESIFVNDGSTDGTGNEIHALSGKSARVRAIHFRENRGQSAALCAGLASARGEYILTLDGDLQNDPEDFGQILSKLKDYHCVCGLRAVRSDHWAKRAASRVANCVRRAILGDNIRDTGCGLKGFRRECIEHIVPFDGVHRYIPILLQAAGFSIAQCEVNHRPRKRGQSKYGILDRAWRGIFDLMGVAWLIRRRLGLHVNDVSINTPDAHENSTEPSHRAARG